MSIDPHERQRADTVIKKAGFDKADFSLQLVEIRDQISPDKSYRPSKRYRVTRASNGKSREYETGHGTVWPDDLKEDLTASVFGEP